VKNERFMMLVSMYQESTGIEVNGVGSPEDFLDFIDTLITALPMFLVEFVRERVTEETQEELIKDLLMKFVLLYLEKPGVQVPGLNSFLDQAPTTPDTTVH